MAFAEGSHARSQGGFQAFRRDRGRMQNVTCKDVDAVMRCCVRVTAAGTPENLCPSPVLLFFCDKGKPRPPIRGSMSLYRRECI